MATSPTPGEAQVLVTAVEDLGVRALHTFWQASAATAATLWAASGLDVHELASVAGLEKLAVVVVGGAGAAGLSAVKTLLVTVIQGRKVLNPAPSPAPAPAVSEPVADPEPLGLTPSK